MWRRQANDRADFPPADPDSESALEASARWEERWSRPEEERVARWLGVKGRNDDMMRAGVAEDEWRLAPAFATDLEQPEGQASAVTEEAALEALKADLAALEAHRSDVATALAAERSDLAMVEQRKRELVAELEAERVELHEERRRLVTALHAEQLEVDRVRRVWTEAKAGRDAEMSALDEQRGRLIEATESALAAADRAAIAESEAVARLKAVEEQTTRVEAERFAVWVALDAEITALEERRQQLRGGTGPGDRA